MPATEAPKAPQPLGDLSGPWILFVDNHCVAERKNVTRSYHAFERNERKPLLESAYVFGTVLPKGRGHGYRMWYTHYKGGNTYQILYATSDNGLLWQNEELCLPSGNHSNPQVIHTPKEQNPYKLIFGNQPYNEYYGAFSSDGIRWTYVKSNPILEEDDSDVGNFFWDQKANKYIGYPKIFITLGPNRRCVGLSTTTAFENKWPPPKVMLVPDYIDDKSWVKADGQRTEFYGLCGFAYESMYLGFLWIFRITGSLNDHDDGPIFVELVTSHDGVSWRRQAEDSRKPVLSGEPGTWDAGVVYTSNRPLVENGTVKLYYGAAALTHAHEAPLAIGLATLRKDGFASLDAKKGFPGSVLTRKCLGVKGPLHVNFKTNDGGSLRAEVLDGSGKVVEGYGHDECHELKGDFVDAVVKWKEHTELPKRTGPLQIRFLLKDASLYSFAAGDAVKVLSFFPGGVLYTFGGDIGRRIVRNKLSDGEQDGRLIGNHARVVYDPHGAPALLIEGNGNAQTPNTLEIPGTTNLGAKFTLSAMVNMSNQGRTRIFSSFCGTSINMSNTPASYEVLFDFDPASGSDFPGRLRACIQGEYILSKKVKFVGDEYHHFAMTYAERDVTLYFDGNKVGSGLAGGRGGPVFSYYELRVGQDWGGTAQQQLAGYVREILILPQLLTDKEIAELCQQGAEQYFQLTS